MGTASDEALLAGIATGDAASARTFVRRYQQRVFGLALTILHDRQGAEDVAQDAFVRIWRHAGAFDARRGNVAPWVLTITRNAALDALRLRRATPADPETIVALGLPSTERSPADLAEHGHDVERVRRVLAELPVEQRDAVLLAAFHGQTAAEIAERESIPLGTAKTRIRTGLRKLRDRLDEEANRRRARRRWTAPPSATSPRSWPSASRWAMSAPRPSPTSPGAPTAGGSSTA